MNNNKKLLGKRIKELRKLNALTQEKLAELIDIETSSLSAIESGRHFPSLPTLEKIANNLNVEMMSLFDFKHHQSLNDLKETIINSVNKMDDSKKLIFIYKFLEELK